MTLLALRKVVSKSSAHGSRTKAYKQRKPVLLTYKQKQYVIGALLLGNSLLGVATLNQTPIARMQGLSAVQAAMVAQPTVQAASVKPVSTPAEIQAQVQVEKVDPTKAPIPTPTPKTAVAGVSISRSVIPAGPNNWDAMLQQYFGANWQAAKRVMLCESGGNPNAINRSSGATGLMQIMPLPGRPSQQALLDPATNLAQAVKISSGGTNWGPWTCKP